MLDLVKRLLSGYEAMKAALGKYVSADEWKVRDEPMNFCTDDCSALCDAHTLMRKQKYKTLPGAEIARDCLASLTLKGES